MAGARADRPSSTGREWPAPGPAGALLPAGATPGGRPLTLERPNNVPGSISTRAAKRATVHAIRLFCSICTVVLTNRKSRLLNNDARIFISGHKFTCAENALHLD